MKYDNRQLELVDILSGISFSVNNQKFRWLPSKKIQNIYIYGGVGRGKTMIAKFFFESLRVSKIFIHYQDFMKLIQQQLFEYRQSATNKNYIIKYIAKDLCKKYRYICIDEFEVHDIADAMILSHLFGYIKKYRSYILITSNVEVDELYKNGLQREQFLSFVYLIKKSYVIFPLDGLHDYRKDKIQSGDKILYPLNEATTKAMDEIKERFTSGYALYESTIELYGRKIVFPYTYKNILITDFDSLCKKEFSSSDFIEISKYFSVIILENVRVIDYTETDVITRFISLIDNIYFHKILLFMSMENSIENIYVKGKKMFEFKRIISRVYELNSEEYIKQSKYYIS